MHFFIDFSTKFVNNSSAYYLGGGGKIGKPVRLKANANIVEIVCDDDTQGNQMSRFNILTI